MPDEALFFASAYDEICVSSDVAGEFGKVLGRGRFASRVGFSERARAVSALMERAIEFTPRERIRDCRDPKDDKYLELALEAGAWAIVSGDRDLLELDPWRGVRILTPRRIRPAGERARGAQSTVRITLPVARRSRSASRPSR